MRGLSNIDDHTGVSLGVVWTLLLGVVAVAGLVISAKLDLQAMQLQARQDRAIVRLIAEKVGVQLPAELAP